MSFMEKYIENPVGRSGLISLIITLGLWVLAGFISLTPWVKGAWYSFLYKDVTIAPEDRYNILLVIIDIVLITISYFYLTVALGNFAELRNSIPGWTEVGTSIIISGVIAFFQPKFTISGKLSGTDKDLGYSHFTPDMQITVFWVSLLMILLTTFYIFKTEPKEGNI